MCKSFFLEPGHLARCGRLWYEPGILLVIEAHERLEIFVARNGMPAGRCGRYSYGQLDPRRPPVGLMTIDRGLHCAMPRLFIVATGAREAVTRPAQRSTGAGLPRPATRQRIRARRLRWPALIARTAR
jgi:hypothetical protein